jgi:hypothetical protein
MKAYESMSYWDAYNLPIPIRKWLITRYNKHVESQGKQSDSDKPLTQEERVRMINQAQQIHPKPLSARTFMTPTRNR